MRYVVEVRYRGTHYSGWQVQENATTVQGELDRCISLLLKRPVRSYGAGRTDAGVHALHMPAHFDHDEALHPAFFKSLNAILPSDISIVQVFEAIDDSFHARFSATSRSYRYHMIFEKDPFWFERSWWCKEKVDFEAMQKGAAIIKEYDSFESFCKTNANNKTFFCDIRESYWQWEGDSWTYHVTADRFLRGMVRTIVGTLFEMGKGNLDEAGLRKIIEGRDRKLAGTSVYGGGLFLTEVGYPEGMLRKLAPESIVPPNPSN